MMFSSIVSRWLTVVTAVVLYLSNCTPMNVGCPKWCKCDSILGRMTCIGRQQKIFYIPTPPHFVKKLKVANNRLPHLTRESFDNVSRLALERLCLNEDMIASIDEDAFQGFHSLTHLDLSGNRLQSDDGNFNFSKAFGSIQNAPIYKLSLENIGLRQRYLPDDLFLELNGSSLQHLSLRRNGLETFSSSILQFLPNLLVLDLTSNALQTILFAGPLKLQSLYLDKNKISVIPPKFCEEDEDKTFLGHLQILGLRNNFIDRITNCSFSCLKQLKKLYLDENPIRKLRNNLFLNNPKLKLVSLKSLMKRLESIHGFAFNSTSLERLYLDGNSLVFRPKIGVMDLENIFKWTPNLQRLDLSNNNLVNLNESHFKQMFSPLQKLEVLVLQGCMIPVLPEGVFGHLSSLKRLILKGNKFSTWDQSPGVFENVSSLEDLSIQGCNIYFINETSFPQSLLTSLKTLDVGDNPFSCTCGLTWFVDWIGRTNITLLNYPGRYKCRFPPEMTGILLKDFHPTQEICGLEPFGNLITAGFFTALVTLIMLGFYANNSRKRTKQTSPRPAVLPSPDGSLEVINHVSMEECRYDVFVSYCETDSDWVHDVLLGKLENEMKFTLCIHMRDFVGGRRIFDNILESMKTSRRIIHIVSNNSVKSDWCTREIELADACFVAKGLEIVLVILLQDIKDFHGNALIEWLLNTRTYVKWPVNENQRQLFWEHLVTFLHK